MSIAALVLASTAMAVPARAELVFFSTGRSLSVKSHRVEGDSLVLVLRSGGEMICERSTIVQIAPDEVPYPEPPPPAAAPAEPLPVDTSVYDSIIDSVSAKHGVNPRLVRALIKVESGYQERARSRKGAMGLMQLMPDTARQLRVSDPYDPAANIEGGIRYLKMLLDRYPLRLALAAYNAGEAAVERFQGIPPYAETRRYVAAILQLAGQ